MKTYHTFQDLCVDMDQINNTEIIYEGNAIRHFTTDADEVSQGEFGIITEITDSGSLAVWSEMDLNHAVSEMSKLSGSDDGEGNFKDGVKLKVKGIVEISYDEDDESFSCMIWAKEISIRVPGGLFRSEKNLNLISEYRPPRLKILEDKRLIELIDDYNFSNKAEHNTSEFLYQALTVIDRPLLSGLLNYIIDDGNVIKEFLDKSVDQNNNIDLGCLTYNLNNSGYIDDATLTEISNIVKVGAKYLKDSSEVSDVINFIFNIHEETHINFSKFVLKISILKELLSHFVPSKYRYKRRDEDDTLEDKVNNLINILMVFTTSSSTYLYSNFSKPNFSVYCCAALRPVVGNEFLEDCPVVSGLISQVGLNYRDAQEDTANGYKEGMIDIIKRTFGEEVLKTNIINENRDRLAIFVAMSASSIINESNFITAILNTAYNGLEIVAHLDGEVSANERRFLKEFKEQMDSVVMNMEDNNKTESMSMNERISIVREKLDGFIGQQMAKERINAVISQLQVEKARSEHGLTKLKTSNHLIFVGNPGTGKTTYARVLAEALNVLGYLESGHLVEVDRGSLVAEYVGQTAVKTKQKIDEAIGGVLFIDEAYSLVSKGENDYGYECIETLLKRMEDDRDRFVVIVAGYSNEMQNFINSNPGLESRFKITVDFHNYSSDECFSIFQRFVNDSQIQLDGDIEIEFKNLFQVLVGKENFANGRTVRNVFEDCLEAQSNRLVKDSLLNNPDELNKLKLSDLQSAIKKHNNL